MGLLRLGSNAIGLLPTDFAGKLASQPARKTLMETIAGFSGQADAAPSVQSSEPRGILAYHGSPHDFDRFSMDKIGTGEGAQAYGHGLYFAENEGVARGYRDALSDRSAKLGEFVKASGEKLDVLDAPDGFYSLLGEQPDNTSYDQLLKAAQEKLEWAQTRRGGLRDELSRKAQSVLDFVKENEGIKFERNPDRGRMYEVNINANPEDFLDWDKTGHEQSESVRKALTSIANQDPQIMQAFREAMRRGDRGAIYESILQGRFGDIRLNQEAAANRLKEAGILGIRYLDAGSRGAGDGTRNYVIFDENLINIVRKYGIAGAAAMLGVSTMDVEQAMAQEADPAMSEIDAYLNSVGYK